MSVGRIRIMKRWGALVQPRGPPLTLFYGHFMAPIYSKWPYLAIGSPSSPKWVEYWVNRVEHCISHPGGQLWPFGTMFNHVEPMFKPFVVAGTAYGQIWPFLAKKGSFWGGVLGLPNAIFWGPKGSKLTPPDVKYNVQPWSTNAQPI